MGLESEVQEVDNNIIDKVNNASKVIVVDRYQPLFDKVKKIALVHMEQNGIEELELISGVYFRNDGNFNHYYFSVDGKNEIGLEDLPTMYCVRCNPDDIKKMVPGFTDYHSQMHHTFNSFKKAIQESLASVLA